MPSEDEEVFANVPIRDLIESLRGGAPETCDWCGVKGSDLDPVSGDQWVCKKCLFE